MLTKITALTLAAVSYVNGQAFANVEDRAFLNNLEMYPIDKKLEQSAVRTNTTINDHKVKPIFDFDSNDTSAEQCLDCQINNDKGKNNIIDFDKTNIITEAVVFGWGPDYEGLTPATTDIKFKCNLLVDFMYFYNIVPLHGDLHMIKSNDSSIVYMVFCDPMTSAELTSIGCDVNLKTMAVYKDATGCHSIAGPDMQTNTNYNI